MPWSTPPQTTCTTRWQPENVTFICLVVPFAPTSSHMSRRNLLRHSILKHQRVRFLLTWVGGSWNGPDGLTFNPHDNAPARQPSQRALRLLCPAGTA